MTPNRPLRLIAGALLVSGLSACGGANKPAETTVTETKVVETAPTPEPAPQPVADAPAATAPATVTLASLTGDAANGEKIFGQCKTCHVAEKGVNRIGPSLWGVVDRPAGSIAGYSYSAANKNSGITWTAEKLFTYLEAPQKTVPGTKMAFAGLKKPQDRADVIAYLKTRA
ncbi:MAG: cytochrome c family protein [Sandarakinorhabdus sp.]|nr:cytochrome c family protein [Sandarakinorhabdus sp.]